MCVYSMAMDWKFEEWEDRFPWIYKEPLPTVRDRIFPPIVPPVEPMVTPEEIKEFRRLLEKAKKYDIDNGEPECELESKKIRLRDFAKQLGVEIDFV